VNSYSEDVGVKGSDLKWNTKECKSDAEREINKWLDGLKSEYDVSKYKSKQIPMISLRNQITHLPIYIDNECRIRDFFKTYTNTATETINKLNQWIENDEVEFKLWMTYGYSKPFEKVCLLSQNQLRQRGLI